MKNYRSSRIITFVTTIVCLLFSMSTIAFAAGPGNVDKNAQGSLNIKFVDTDEEPITGGNVEIFYVASIEEGSDGNDKYVLNSDFASLTIDYDDFGTAEFANEAADIVKAKRLAGEVKDVDSNGYAYFGKLPVGMYLITQPEANDGWYAFNPYIATIPLNVNGQWVYDLDSIPKMEPYCEEIIVEPTVTPTPGITTTPTVTPVVTPTTEPTVTPVVTPDTTPTPETTPVVTVTPEVTPDVTPEVTPVVTPEVTPDVTPGITVVPSTTPTPSTETTVITEDKHIIAKPGDDTITITINNIITNPEGETIITIIEGPEFGEVIINDDGTFTYRPKVPGVTTDKFTFTVTNNGRTDTGIVTIEFPSITPTPTSVPSVTTKPGDKIPQTGKLNWPIPVLSFLGIALILTGWSIKKSDR